GLALLVAIVRSLADMIPARPIFRLIVAAGFLGITGVHFSMAAVQGVRWTLALLTLDYLVLLVAFSYVDVLALTAAIFTFAFTSANHSMVVMFSPWIDTPRIALAVWSVVILLAVAALFQRQLRSAYQQLSQPLQ